MGLAPYGEPRYADVIHEQLIDLSDDGSFRLDMDYFDYCAGLTMTNARFDELFGGPPRAARVADHAARDGPRGVDPGGDRGGRCCAWRATSHAKTGMNEPRAWPAASRSTAWPTAGCCARGRSTTSGSSRRPATPAARSARRCSSGTSCSTSRATPTAPRRACRAPTSGPRFADDEIAAFLDAQARPYEPARRPTSCCADGRRLLADGKVVGWFQGRMEFGPRALGAPQHPRRPALADDAVDDEPQDQVPRVVPAVRAGRAARARRRLLRARPATVALHAAGRAGARRAPRRADERADAARPAASSG